MEKTSTLPTHDFHAQHGARFVPFGGWQMPVQYRSILAEHLAVRQGAGLFDVSHMGEFHVGGSDAAAFLDRLLVNRIGTAAIGKAVYSPMCQEDGGTVDDLIVYRTGANQYLVCVNASNAAKDFDWMCARQADWNFEISLANRSTEYGLLALQGPRALEVLAAAGLTAPAKRFTHHEEDFDGAAVRICRTGYTGEDGVEIFTPAAKTAALAASLLHAGQPQELQLCGLGARDSLRLEAGYPLYGHELSASISPLEAGLGWAVKLDKGEFVGRAALQQQLDGGPMRKLVHFTLEGRRIARQGTSIEAQGNAVGEVLSGTLSPLLECPIGSALVAGDASVEDLCVNLRGHSLPLQVRKPPLHRS